MYFFSRSERVDVPEDGVDSESVSYFLPKNDFVEGVVVDGSAYFFIISERLGVDVDGVDSPSSPYFRLKIDGVVDGVSKLFGSAGGPNGDELLGINGTL